MVSSQFAVAQQNLIRELDVCLVNDGWMENQLHIFITVYYSHIFKCKQDVSGCFPFHVHVDFELVHISNSQSGWVYGEMDPVYWWLDTQDLPATDMMIVPVLCASGKTHLSDFCRHQ